MSMQIFEIKNICPICWCTKFHHKYFWNDYYYNTTNNQFEIIECNHCKLEQIYPIPTKYEQTKFYPKNYYSYNKKSEKTNFNKIISYIISFIFSPFTNKKIELPTFSGKGKNFLDIWCWDGFNIDKVKQLGWNAKGFEISDKICFKDDIYYWPSIVDVNFGEKFDYIRCHHVIEHVDNPVEFLNKILSILSTDWIFVLTLPNVKNLTSNIFWKYASDRDIPRHLFWYNFNNIEILLKKCGFHIVSKYKKAQVNSSMSFSWMLIWKYNIDIRNTVVMKIIWLLFLPIEFFLSCIGNTNQMCFILKKKK